jgi:Domain of unknown function (DUF4304)
MRPRSYPRGGSRPVAPAGTRNWAAADDNPPVPETPADQPELRTPAGWLSGRFNALLTDEVRPFLKARGFAKSGPTFVRRRPPVYDVINFQGSSGNGLGAVHKFFVNVGMGSSAIDEATGDSSRPSKWTCLYEQRWGSLVAGVPVQVEFSPTSDMRALADRLRAWLGELVDRFDHLDSTEAILDLAIEENFLHNYEKICSYLSGCGDSDRLSRYVRTLRTRFIADLRWDLFNRRIAETVGPAQAQQLAALGLLDPF